MCFLIRAKVKSEDCSGPLVQRDKRAKNMVDTRIELVTSGSLTPEEVIIRKYETHVMTN